MGIVKGFFFCFLLFFSLHLALTFFCFFCFFVVYSLSLPFDPLHLSFSFQVLPSTFQLFLSLQIYWLFKSLLYLCLTFFCFHSLFLYMFDSFVCYSHSLGSTTRKQSVQTSKCYSHHLLFFISFFLFSSHLIFSPRKRAWHGYRLPRRPQVRPLSPKRRPSRLASRPLQLDFQLTTTAEKTFSRFSITIYSDVWRKRRFVLLNFFLQVLYLCNVEITYF